MKEYLDAELKRLEECIEEEVVNDPNSHRLNKESVETLYKFCLARKSKLKPMLTASFHGMVKVTYKRPNPNRKKGLGFEKYMFTCYPDKIKYFFVCHDDTDFWEYGKGSVEEVLAMQEMKAIFE